MKKLISAVTSLCMAATMVSSIAPSVSAAGSKGFALRTYADADSEYAASGSDVKISADAIAAGDVTVPCAVYLTEDAADTQSFSVQFTVNSDNADVKNVSMKTYLPSEDYFAADKTFATGAGTEFTTARFPVFSGSVNGRGNYSTHGAIQLACDPQQKAANTDNYFIGCSWTNNGADYSWLGSKSDTYPVFVFDVTFPQGTAQGTYTLDYCKYNTSSNPDQNNPSCMIETSERFTEELGNLTLSNMTFTIGDAATPPTTTAPPDATTTAPPTPTTTAPDPGPGTDPTPDADVVFDFQNYLGQKADSEVFVDVLVHAPNVPVSAMDVIFKIDSPLEISAIESETPAYKDSVMVNLALPGCNFKSVDGSGDARVAADGDCVFQLTVKIPAGTPDGDYHIGFADKCDVFRDNTSFTYSTAFTNGLIQVGEGGPVTTPEPTAPVTTTDNGEPATTTAPPTPTTQPSTNEGDPVWGDTNCDGVVKINDVVILNKWLNDNSAITISDQGKLNADCCNPEGGAGLNSEDSDAIIRSIVHLVTLPVTK